MTEYPTTIHRVIVHDCPTCAATGQGQVDGGRCIVCQGHGCFREPVTLTQFEQGGPWYDVDWIEYSGEDVAEMEQA